MKYIIILVCLIISANTQAHDISQKLIQVENLIYSSKYQDAMSVLSSIEKDCLSDKDSLAMLYNYYKGDILYETEKYADAIPCLKHALQIKETLSHADCEYLEILGGLGMCYCKLKQYKEAEVYLRKVMIHGDNSKYECEIIPTALQYLVEVYKSENNFHLADLCTEKLAERTISGISGKNIDEQIEELQGLANAYEKNDQIEKAIDVYYKQLELIKNSKGKNNEDYLSVCFLIGENLYIKLGKAEEAYIIFDDAINVSRKLASHYSIIGTSYALQLQIMSKLGKIEGIEDFITEAEQYCTEVEEESRPKYNLRETTACDLYNAGSKELGIKILESLQNNRQHNYTIRALYSLGDYYYFTDSKKSLEYMLKCKDAVEANANANVETKKSVYNTLSGLYTKNGDYESALKYCKISDSYYDKKDKSDDYIIHLRNYAELDGRLNNCKEFEILSNKAELLSNEDNKNFNYLVSILSSRGYVYVINNQPDKALTPILRAIEIVRKNGDEQNWLVNLYHNGGKAYMLLNKFKEALNFLNESKQLQMKAYGKVMPKTLEYIKECESK